MKKLITVISLLLIGLLSFSAMQMLSGNFVSAYVAPVVFCPNTWCPPPTGPDTEYEVWLSETTCGYIVSMLAGRYYPVGCYYSFNDDCTSDHYYELLDWTQYYYDQVVVFSKGHRGVPYPGYSHLSLLDHDGYEVIDNNRYFNTIYDYTSSEKNTFTFIWHCETALYYPGEGNVPEDDYGYYGMPYCWTHNAYMNQYGETGSQVYLGWTDEVPDEPYPETWWFTSI